MAGIQFDVNSSRAKELVQEVFAKVKEIWDPALSDDAVAQYAVAMVAKGYDRKKLQNSLNNLLGEDTTKDLVDWLMRHVTLHKNELTSSKALPKPAKKSHAKQQEEQGAGNLSSEARPAAAKQAPEQHLQQQQQQHDADEGGANNVDALLQEGLEEDEEDEALQEEEEQQPASHQQQQQAAAPAAGPSGRTKADHQGRNGRQAGMDASAHRAREGSAEPQPEQEQQQAKRSRVRSAIQWTQPAPAGGGPAMNGAPRSSKAEVAPRVSELEARRQRFGLEAGEHRERDGKERDRQREREGGRRGSADGDERDRGGRGMAERHREREREMGSRLRSRSRSRSPRGWDAPPRGPSAPYWDRDAAEFPPLEPHWDRGLGHPARDSWRGGGEEWSPGRHRGRGMEGRHPDRLDVGPPLREPEEEGDGMGMPPRKSPRPRLRSVVSGSMDGSMAADEAAPAEPEPAQPHAERHADPVLASARMLGRAFGGGSSIFQRLSGGKFGAAARLVKRDSDPAPLAQQGRGAKRPAADSSEDASEVSESDEGSPDRRQPAGTAQAAATPPKVRRTQAGQSVGSALVAGAARADHTGAGAAEARPHAVHAAGGRPMQLQGQAQQRQAASTVVAGAIQAARMRQAKQAAAQQQQQQQQQAATAAGAVQPAAALAAGPPHHGKPGAAALSAAAKPFVPSGAKPAAGLAAPLAKPNGMAAAGGALSEMEQLMAELKAKELEINRMKAQVGIQGSAGQRQAPPQLHAAAVARAPPAEAAARRDADARSVVVHNFPNISDQQLMAHFGPCGNIVRITVLRDKRTNLPTGSAYVEFAALEGKAQALQLNGSRVQDAPLRVVPKPLPLTAASTRPPVAQLAGGAVWPAPQPQAPPAAGGAGLGAMAMPMQPKRLGDAPPLRGGMVWRRPGGDAAGAAAGAQAQA